MEKRKEKEEKKIWEDQVEGRIYKKKGCCKNGKN